MISVLHKTETQETCAFWAGGKFETASQWHPVSRVMVDLSPSAIFNICTIYMALIAQCKRWGCTALSLRLASNPSIIMSQWGCSWKHSCPFACLCHFARSDLLVISVLLVAPILLRLCLHYAWHLYVGRLAITAMSVMPAYQSIIMYAQTAYNTCV